MFPVESVIIALLHFPLSKLFYKLHSQPFWCLARNLILFISAQDWDREKLLEAWMKDAEECCQRSGVQMPNPPPSGYNAWDTLPSPRTPRTTRSSITSPDQISLMPADEESSLVKKHTFKPTQKERITQLTEDNYVTSSLYHFPNKQIQVFRRRERNTRQILYVMLYLLGAVFSKTLKYLLL